MKIWKTHQTPNGKKERKNSETNLLYLRQCIKINNITVRTRNQSNNNVQKKREKEIWNWIKKPANCILLKCIEDHLKKHMQFEWDREKRKIMQSHRIAAFQHYMFMYDMFFDHSYIHAIRIVACKIIVLLLHFSSSFYLVCF